MIRAITVLLLAGLLATPALGQRLPAPPAPAADKTLRLHAPLQQAITLAGTRRFGAAALRAELAARRITLSSREEVHVEIVGPPGTEGVTPGFIARFGGNVENRVLNLVDCWIPIARLRECARALPAGHFITNPNAILPQDVPGEGPVVVNSIGYPTGAGVSVAIMDNGFEGLDAAVANGDAPGTRTDINYTAEPFQFGSIHGTGCTEAVFDHSPAATYRLYKVDSEADWLSAVLDCISTGVRVLSCSLVHATSGWHDNTGTSASALNIAANAGILVLHSAGNYANCHYQHTFNSGSGGADWHDFGPGDETIDIEIDAGAQVNFSLLWNRDGDTYDYDFYLYDDNFNELASSTNGSDYYEWFSWTNNGANPVVVHVAVLRFDGGNTEFEIYTHYGSWQEHQVASNSVPAPGNATHPNVLHVGAVPHDSYGEPPGSTGIIASYSSRGPTNDGTAMPSLCGPTNTASFIYDGPMGGTSNAAPNCAGAAVCFLAADPLLSATGIRWLLLDLASYWKDWGAGGQDPIYGRGGLILADFVPQRIWVASGSGNWSEARDMACTTVAGALQHATAGGNVQIFPGGSFPESLAINQWVTIRTTAEPAAIGQ